jgi:dTDP-4-dehydrorhamnose reductase
MWLVVGANGQLGRSLQDVLVQKNVEYVATTRKDLDVSNSDAVSQFLSNGS